MEDTIAKRMMIIEMQNRGYKLTIMPVNLFPCNMKKIRMLSRIINDSFTFDMRIHHKEQLTGWLTEEIAYQISQQDFKKADKLQKNLEQLEERCKW